MRVIKTQKGFTIVETLIVVAVTGALFMATSLLLVGQIARATFRESSLNLQQVLNDSLNDVSSGYLIDLAKAPAGCGGSASNVGDSDCVYVGKYFQLDKANSTITSTPLFVNEDEDPFDSTTSVKTVSTNVVKELPSGFDYTRDVEYTVLFEKYSDRSNPIKNPGEAQSVGVYNGGPTGPFTKSSEILVCATNGSRQAEYTLGSSGSPTVTLEYKFTGCP